MGSKCIFKRGSGLGSKKRGHPKSLAKAALNDAWRRTQCIWHRGASKQGASLPAARLLQERLRYQGGPEDDKNSSPHRLPALRQWALMAKLWELCEQRNTERAPQLSAPSDSESYCISICEDIVVRNLRKMQVLLNPSWVKLARLCLQLALKLPIVQSPALEPVSRSCFADMGELEGVQQVVTKTPRDLWVARMARAE